jgi:CheY-like chemotaxis protein
LLSEDLSAVLADRRQIEQMILDLFVNAADAMPGGGKLIIETSNVTHEDMKGNLYDPKPGNYVQLKMTDTGVGIDKETQDRIFDPFFTTKQMHQGRGLGLASVYGIVKGHGGYIDVESAKNYGTTFSIYLPATDQINRKSDKLDAKAVGNNLTILLVDDELMVLDVGAKMLKKMGYDILEAKSGLEAIEVYRENKDRIDMVILDMILPEINGGDVYDKIKEINPDAKVLLSSGYSIDGRATEILNRGCNEFIQKPFRIKELLTKINQVMA